MIGIGVTKKQINGFGVLAMPIGCWRVKHVYVYVDISESVHFYQNHHQLLHGNNNSINNCSPIKVFQDNGFCVHRFLGVCQLYFDVIIKI